MAIVQVTIVPIGTGKTSVSSYVADIIRVLQEASRTEAIHYEMTPMSTIIEGDLGVILQVIQRMHEVPFEKGALRVSTSLTIDDRRDQPSSMEQKVQSVSSKLASKE